jgi:hypothetical protein
LRGGFFIFSSIGEAVSNTKKRDLTAPLTFILSRKGREEKKDERKRMTLTAPLTFILSRRGREGGKENDFNGTSYFNYFSLGEKGKES